MELFYSFLMLSLAAVSVGMHPVPMPHVDSAELEVIVRVAQDTVTRQLNAVEKASGQTPGSPAWFAAASARIKVIAKNISEVALVAEETTRQLATKYHLTKDQINLALPTLMVRGTLLGDQCPVEVDFPCQPKRYRAYNGYCNNVQNPRWGNSNTRYLRFLPADYGDGVSSLRLSSRNSVLPSARNVSSIIHEDEDKPHSHVTTLFATWLQFVSHDVAHTSQAVGVRGRRLKCCNIPDGQLHPECAPINVSAEDPFYGSRGITCLDYIRSCMGPRTGCMLGPREQVNQVTSFLDGSVIYGSSKEEVDDLRSFKLGQLKTQPGGLLPPDDNHLDCRSDGRNRCFKSGDIRVNENLGLAIMHTLWVREHNRLANALYAVNPHWNDEILFQEARRIVAAEIQHIQYNEFLPLLVGRDLMSTYSLNPISSGYSSDYDVDINPGISSSISAAVLRCVLSMLPPSFQLHENSADQLLKSSYLLSSAYYAPLKLYNKSHFNGFLIGLLRKRMQTVNEAVSYELTRHLFSDNNGSGLDAVSATIQQGRDHGLPGYTKWRQICGLRKVATFEDFRGEMTDESIFKLKSVYESVDDVDLFTGGLAEIVNSAVLGRTFGCLLGKQFSSLRHGDRYWYENDMPPTSFSREQLSEIRKVTLARIACDNSDVLRVQPSVFVGSDPFLNALMECNSDMIRALDLDKWRQNNQFEFGHEVLQESLNRARRDVEERKTNEHRAFLNHFGVASEKSPIGIHLGFVRPKREAISISNTSLVLQFASQNFVNNFLQGRLQDLESNAYIPKDVEELMNLLPNVDISDFVDIPRSFECDEQTLPCDHTSRFRTFTGLCNNLDNPTFGKSFKAFQRLLPPVYDDNVSEPRSKSVSGSALPSARLISISIHSDVSQPHTRYTLMTMQFGQFIDHDLSHTPVHTGFEGAILDCSRCDSRSKIHPECLPIPIPPSDPFFPSNGTGGVSKCLSLVRSLPGQLTMGSREQINQITPYIDCSHVYGSDICDSRKLRSFVSGRLNVTHHPSGGKDLLPQTNQNKECKSKSGLCFDAGDKRASEQTGLAAMHTLFMREHNRIVAQLAKVNLHWSDEQLFQNTRRILSAINQHIVFSEFLPRVMGWAAVHEYGLELRSEGFRDDYDPTCNAATFNEFSTAAFRFGHSLIKPFIQRIDQFFHQSKQPLKLRQQFFNPDDLYKVGMIDEIMRGLFSTSMETLDQFITSEVTNHLFEDAKIPFSGLDLVALNLQRAREHGIATYNQMRRFCHLKHAKSFEDFTREIPTETVNKLKGIYRHVDDVDLFTGGLVETPLSGALVGPTFACILGHQFRQLSKCDRFWYETSNPLLRFTSDQLMEIRKATLAKIICENSDSIDSIQQQVFDLPDDFMNPRVPCHTVLSINLNLWAERASCSIKSQTIPIGSAKRVSPCVMCTCTTEGSLCQSIKIANCFDLVSSFKSEDILSDQVCKVQCAFVFRASSHLEGNNILSIRS